MIIRLQSVIGQIIEEDHIHIEREQVGGGEEHLLLELGQRLEQEVHRPVAVGVGRLLQSIDVAVVSEPAGRLKLRRGRQRPRGNQAEQHPLDPGRVDIPDACRATVPQDAAAETCTPVSRQQHPLNTALLDYAFIEVKQSSANCSVRIPGNNRSSYCLAIPRSCQRNCQGLNKRLYGVGLKE